MYKNQLQELAQRSCFNLPSYACIREGPDHAPRFKASVNFCGEVFESPNYCTTLRQAEHSAAEVALNVLSSRCPSKSLTARVLDETGVYKNLLQETAHRAGLKLPVYTTVRSGPGHVPVFTCTVELAGLSFNGEAAKTKKQAEKNAAIAAWSSLKTMPNLTSNCDETKRIRRKENQTQGGRRMVRGLREDGPSNYSPHYSQQIKLRDLLLDDYLESLTNKQTCFVSLLPPPPPRTTSKILPPSPPPSMARPVQAIVQEVPPLLEEHQKEEEDQWLNGKKGEVTGMYNNNKTFSVPPTTCGHMGRTTYNGRYHHPQRIAPAVQIRSVIPVCAAPPQAMRPLPSNPPSVVLKEVVPSTSTSSSSAASTSKSTNTTELNSMVNSMLRL
ncbi:hypothetical protein LguiA_019749 [Lonicera macranthoides]